MALLASLGAALGALGLAAGCGVSAILLGLPIWRRLMRRSPSASELAGIVFVLGLVPLVLASAALVLARALTGPAPLLVWLTAAAAAGLASRSQVMEAASTLGAAARASMKAQPWAWWVLGGCVLLGALISPILTTAGDARSYHYGMVSVFRRTGSLWPQGYSHHEHFHLNGQLLNALWMGIGGEAMANCFSLAQSVSFAATIYWMVRSRAEASWAWTAALMAITLPSSMYQATGGWNDLLLAQCVLCAYAAYDRSLTEPQQAGWMSLAGIAAGFAWGVKQNAPTLLLPLGVTALYQAVRGRTRWSAMLRMVLVGGALAGPWVARTWITTGNPLFPAFPQWTRMRIPSFAANLDPKGTTLDFIANSFSVSNWLNHGIPFWVLGITLLGCGLGLVAWKQGAMMRWRLGAASIGLALGIASPAGGRYGIFFFVFGLAVALGFLATRPTRPMLLVRTLSIVLSVGLGWGIGVGRVWHRRAVLLGAESERAYVESRFPQAGLLRLAAAAARPGDALLVLDGMQYQEGLTIYDGDPSKPGRRVWFWPFASSQEILSGFERLGIRWIAIGYQGWVCRAGMYAWTNKTLGVRQATPEQVRTCVARTFPEWDLSSLRPGPATKGGPSWGNAVLRLAQMKPCLRVAGQAPGHTLYEIVDYDLER
jgi:hypothetical protein